MLASSAVRNSSGGAQEGKTESKSAAQAAKAATKPPEKEIALPDDNPFLYLCERLHSPDSLGPNRPKPALVATACSGNSWLQPPPFRNGQFASATTAKSSKAPAAQEVDLSYIVATVPDPELTHLTLFFDRMVESMGRAAENAGFDPDVHWLPWHQPEQLAKELEEKSPEDVRKVRIAAAERRRWPGLLLFHKEIAESQTKYLAIFLIGETPVSGVDVTQLRNVAAYFKGQRRPWGIVGPTFSGSKDLFLDTLRETLQTSDKSPKDPAPVIISGTATNLPVEIPSTVHSDEYSRRALLRLLPPDHKVAWITESDTVYGAAQSNTSTPEDSSPLYLRFPRNIALLRNAYDETSPRTAGRSQTSALPSLILRMKDASGGRDSIPPYSRAQTPVSQDTVLNQIATTLRDERVLSAVVAATDVLDNLFVIRYLRAACPDVRLYTFYSDLLLARPTDQEPLTGNMAVSSYPLISANQLWTGVDGAKDSAGSRRPLFDSQVSEGTYNATLAVLTQLGLNLSGASLAEYRRPFAVGKTTTPPVWLTIAGRSGYYPVALLNVEDDDTKMKKQAAMATPHHDPRPRLWSLFYLGCSALVAIWTIAVVFALRANWRPLVDLRAASSGRFAAERLSGLLVTLLSVLALQLTILAAPLSLAAKDPNSWDAWVTVGLCNSVATGLVCAFVILQWLRSLKSWKHISGLQTAGIVISAILATLAFSVTGRQLLMSQDDSLRSFFFGRRSIDLLNGVAPTLPFLLLIPGYFAWGWTSLQRHIFRVERCPILPHSGQTLTPAADLSAYARENIDGVIGGTDGPRNALLLFLGFAVPAGIIYLLTDRYFQSVEGSAYDQMFAFAVAALTGIVFTSWCQLLLIWARLRRWLEQIELHPLRHAFSFLPAAKSWSPLWAPEVRKRSHILTTRSIGTLRRLANSCEDPDIHAMLTDAATLETISHTFLKRTINDDREGAELRNVLNHLAELAETLQLKLQDEWKKGDFESINKLRSFDDWKEVFKKSKDDLPAVLANEFIALRYLAYIRYVMLHMRNLLTFVILGSVLVVLSLNSYPFLSQHLIGWTCGGMFLLLGWKVVAVFAQMERDATLSRITSSNANELGVDFYRRIFAAGALPVLTLLSTYFPQIGRFIGSFAQPALDIIK